MHFQSRFVSALIFVAFPADYSYLADGTKLSATDAAGDGLVYAGSSVYGKAGRAMTLESAAFSGGQGLYTAIPITDPELLPAVYYAYIRVAGSSNNNIVYLPFKDRTQVSIFQNKINKLFE